MLESGSKTLEVRWIYPGRLTEAMITWFKPHFTQIETREDLYLVGQGVLGLSTKIRGGTLLDIKVSIGDKGTLEVSGRAHGRSRAWEKWSFPLSESFETGAGSSVWVRVGKHRRIGRFSFPDGHRIAQVSSPLADTTTCAVELNRITNGPESWWTLGFEAVGHPDTFRESIEATAALLFSEPVPAGELNVDDSMSYADWLRSSASGSIP